MVYYRQTHGFVYSRGYTSACTHLKSIDAFTSSIAKNLQVHNKVLSCIHIQNVFDIIIFDDIIVSTYRLDTVISSSNLLLADFVAAGPIRTEKRERRLVD